MKTRIKTYPVVVEIFQVGDQLGLVVDENLSHLPRLLGVGHEYLARRREKQERKKQKEEKSTPKPNKTNISTYVCTYEKKNIYIYICTSNTGL